MPICYPKLFIHTFSKKVLYSIKQLIYTSERPASKLADLPGLLYYIETFTSYYHIMQLFVLYGTPSNQHLGPLA